MFQVVLMFVVETFYLTTHSTHFIYGYMASFKLYFSFVYIYFFYVQKPILACNVTADNFFLSTLLNKDLLKNLIKREMLISTHLVNVI